MKELSIFIDESGDFGMYEYHSPYYIVTLLLHDQSVNINTNINHLDTQIKNSNLPNYAVHTAPIIRREYEFKYLSLYERKKIFNLFFNFTRTVDITYHPIIVDKKHLAEDIDLNIRITKQLTAFLRDNIEMFMSYDRIAVYYDYGQLELTNILVTIFTTFFNNVEFKKVKPTNYKLFQAADMLCSLEFLSLKSHNNSLSRSEIKFFKSDKDLYKSYIKSILKKRI